MIGSRKSTKKCSRGRLGVKSHKRSSGKTVKSHCRRVGSRKTSKKASRSASKVSRKGSKRPRPSYRKSKVKAKFMGLDGLASRKASRSYKRSSHKKTAAFEYLPDM